MANAARFWIIAAAACLIVAGGPAWSADYVTQPVASAVALNGLPKVNDSGLTLQGLISEAGTFESNPLLILGGAKSLYGSTTSPEFIVKDATPTTEITADTLINASAFNQSTFNTVDFHSTAGIDTANERWEAGLVEHTDYDTTRTSELSSFNLTTRPFRHTGFQLAPDVSFSPSADDKLSLLGDVATSQYQNKVFSDYYLYSLTPTYVHNIDPENAAVFALQAQHYQATDNIKNANDTIGPSLGWIVALTPDLTAKATGGVQSTRQSGTGITNTGWILNYIFSGDIAYTGLSDTVHFLASRSEYPLGDGQESLLTNLSVTDTHSINDNLLLNLGAGYQSTNDQSSNVSGNLENQYYGTAGLTYRFSNRVDMTGSYQYRYETLSNVAGKAQDHLVSLALTYRLDPGSFK